MLPMWQPRSKQATKPSYKTFFVSCIMYKATEFHRGHVIPAPEQWTNSAKLRATRMGPPYLAAFTVPNAICTWRHSRFPPVPRRQETKDIVLVCISGLLDTIPLFYGALQDSWAGEVDSICSAPDLNSILTPASSHADWSWYSRQTPRHIASTRLLTKTQLFSSLRV
jgi:hypothetical protein